jgi:hypothetical protein
MHFSDLAILKWQIAASGLMSIDYFMPLSWRGRINRVLVDYFTGVQGSIDADLRSAMSYLWVKKWAISVAILSLAASLVISHFLIGSRNGQHSMLTVIEAFVFIVLFAFAVVGLCQTLTPVAVPFLLGTPLRGISTFLTRTEKGPLSGIGFLCLIISFAMRYANQT